VNNLGDTGTGSGQSGDLRYCITQADITPGDNTINFSVTGEITLNSPLPDLSNTTGLMDLEGPGAASLSIFWSSGSTSYQNGILAVDAKVEAQIANLGFSEGFGNMGWGIENAGTLTLNDCKVVDNPTTDILNSGTLALNGCVVGGKTTNGIYNAGGSTSIADSEISGVDSIYYGGAGILNVQGSVNISNSLIHNNVFGGIENFGTMTITGSSVSGNHNFTAGGGILSLGSLTITNSTIADNSVELGRGSPFANGGGISGGGPLTVTNCTIANNRAQDYGGGIDCTGTVTITSSTIVGNSANFGAGIDNQQGGALTVTNTTVSNNKAQGYGGGFYGLSSSTTTITNSTIADNYAYDDGGGIYLYQMAVLTVTDSTMAGNSANVGGGIENRGTVTVTNCTIAGNSATSAGGGSDNDYGGSLTVNNSTIAGNSANMGGGIENREWVTVTNCTIAGNSANVGGGNDNDNGGTLTVTNSTMAGNSANVGGGIENRGTLNVTNCAIAGNSATSAGGGIDNGGTLTVTNSTVAGNSAGNSVSSPGYGGGIVNIGALTITNSTITGNSVSAFGFGGGIWSGGTASLDNSIDVLNSLGTGSSAQSSDIYGSVSGAYNLIGTGGSGGLTNGVNGNQVGVANPGLDPRGLQNNGGPTKTIALAAGSPAIDKGSNALALDPSIGQPLTTDQRGFPRVVGGRIDIGAFEVQSQIATVAVDWGTASKVHLQTASDGLRLLPAGRNADLPWMGINRLQITLAQPATLASGDVTVVGSSGINYGPVTIIGSGTNYTITLAKPIKAADRVTITVANNLIASYARCLDVLPGDVNDDGVVNVQDMVVIRNEMLGLLGAVPTIFGDINGDGKVDINDYTMVRSLIGTHL
jgi:predicted outer membrane repeat protein